MQLWLRCSTITQTVVEPIPNAPHPPLWRSLSCPYCLPAGEHLLLPPLEGDDEVMNELKAYLSRIIMKMRMTRNQINDTFLFQNRVKVKVVGEVSEK